MHRIKTNQIKSISFKIFSFICLSSLVNVQAQQVLEEATTSIDTSYIESKNELSDYILDTGDVLFIMFINAPKISGFYPIDEQGEIYLKRIKQAYVRGLTVTELTKILEKRYSEFLIDPEIHIKIKRFKPIRVEVKGEVRSPGFIAFPYTAISPNLEVEVRQEDFSGLSTSIYDNENPSINSVGILPTRPNRSKEEQPIRLDPQTIYNPIIRREGDYKITLSNAIKAAGGLTSYSDISKIEIIRPVPIGKGGGKKRALIDFLSYTKRSDTKNDIRIFNGDSIFIPTLQVKDPDLVPSSVLSGLSPRYINVNISGQIENPGTVKIPTEGSLSDVMNLTGPRKPLSGKVFLIRYNQDGTLLRKSIRYSSTAAPGSRYNPYLLSGDLITVKNSILGKTSGTLRALTDPLVGIYATKELLESFND